MGRTVLPVRVPVLSGGRLHAGIVTAAAECGFVPVADFAWVSRLPVCFFCGSAEVLTVARFFEGDGGPAFLTHCRIANECRDKMYRVGEVWTLVDSARFVLASGW